MDGQFVVSPRVGQPIKHTTSAHVWPRSRTVRPLLRHQLTRSSNDAIAARQTGWGPVRLAAHIEVGWHWRRILCNCLLRATLERLVANNRGEIWRQNAALNWVQCRPSRALSHLGRIDRNASDGCLNACRHSRCGNQIGDRHREFTQIKTFLLPAK
jgi:hypothetical protein